jgi:hypothetical protein
MMDRNKKHLIMSIAALHADPGRSMSGGLEVAVSRNVGLVFINGDDPGAVLSCAEQMLRARCGLKMVDGLQPAPGDCYKHAITLSRIG